MLKPLVVRRRQICLSVLLLFALVSSLAPWGRRPAIAAESRPGRMVPGAACPDIAGIVEWDVQVSFSYDNSRAWASAGTNEKADVQRTATINLVFERVENPGSIAWRGKSISGSSTINERWESQTGDYRVTGIAQASGPLILLQPLKDLYLQVVPESCTFSIEVHGVSQGTSYIYDKFGYSSGPYHGPYISGSVILNQQPIDDSAEDGTVNIQGSENMPVNNCGANGRKCIFLPYQVGLNMIVDEFGAAGLGEANVNWTIRGRGGSKPSLDLDEELLKRNVYLDDVRVANRFDAIVEWGSVAGCATTRAVAPDVGGCGEVIWKVAQEPEDRVHTSNRKETKEVDVGGLGVGQHLLIAQAKNAFSQTTEPESAMLTVAPLLAWCGEPENVRGVKTGIVITYRCGFKWPEPSFSAHVNPPPFIPFFGGRTVGIVETQAFVDLEVKSSGEGSVKGGAQTGFKAMGGAIVGSFAVKGDVLLDKSGVRIPSGSAEFAIGGKLERQEPLIKAIPAFLVALAWLETFSRPSAQWIASRAYAKLEFEPKIVFAATFEAGPDGIAWKSGEVTPTAGFKVTVALKLYDGDDDDDDIEARIGVGGEVAPTFKVPAPYFKQIDVKFTVFGAIKFRRWLIEREKAWTWSSANLSALARNTQPTVVDPGPGWQPASRAYLTAPDYARWTGVTTTTRGLVDQQLIQNVYPEAKPTFAHNGSGDQYLVWTHDRPGTTDQGGTELAYARGSSTNWSSQPTILTNDAVGDFNPSMVRLPNGRLLVVWERMDTATPPDFTTDPTGYLGHSQIAAGTFLPGSPHLFTPLQLSAGGSLSHRPRVGVLSDGALAVWINNPANVLDGTTTSPDTLLFRRYNQATNTWSAAAPVLTGLAGLVNLELATAGDQAAVLYAQDMDDDPTTEGDRELFYVLYSNGAWGTPVQLTTNSVDDTAPELVLSDTGAPQLLWKQGEQLRFLTGSWDAATSTALPFDEAVSVGSRSMFGGKDGSLALTWLEVAEHDTRIAYAFYDGASQIWSKPAYLQPPVGTHSAEGQSASVGDMAPSLITGLGGEESMVLPYLLADVQPVTRTVEGASIPLVPQSGAHHLRMAKVPLSANLSIEPADLTSSPATAAAGQPVTIAAVVHNSGLRPIMQGTAELVTKPVAGGVETIVATQPIVQLAGGDSATLSFVTTRPATADRSYIVRVKSTLPAVEAQTSDNEAKLGAELTIEAGPTLYTSGGARFQVRITQSGGIPLSGVVTAELHRGGEDGPVVGRTEVAFPLTPTATLEREAWVTAADLGAGSHSLVWNVNPDRQIGEPDYSNNLAQTQALIAADLTTTADDITWGQQPGTTAPIRIWVQNTGSITSTPTTLEVLDGLPPVGQSQAASPQATNRLATLPAPALAPFEKREIVGTLNLAGTPAATSGLKTVVVRIDPDNSLSEVDDADNLALGGQILVSGTTSPSTRRVFVPVVRR